MHSAEVPIAIYEISELSAERQATYSERDRTQRCFCLCGDDRCLTAESTDALKREGAASPDNALRVFGGAQGIAHIFAVSIAAQYGRQKLQEITDGDFVGFIKNVSTRCDELGFIACNHSADKNEEDRCNVNPSSKNGIGCARLANAQTVAELNYSEDIIKLGKNEERAIFTASDDSYIDTIATANQHIVSVFTNEGQKTFNAGRSELIAAGSPVGLVTGAHAPADETVVALNFHPNKVSNPRMAYERNLAFYDIDVTQVAELVMKLQPELNLQPRIIFEAILQDVRATRKALAASENKSPEDLKIEIYGRAEDGLAYLNSITN